MSNQNLEATNPATVPVEGQHTAEAQAMLDRVEAWRKEIRTFAFPVPKGDRRKMATARTVPAELLEQAAVAMRGIESLSRGNNDPDEMRSLVQYALSFGPVAAAIVRLGAEMQHSVDTARAKAGSEALVTYSLAERLSRLPGNEDLVPIVAEMRRTLDTAPRFRTARKAKKSTDAPKPDAGTTPTAPSPEHPVN
jgi:hypothetical protein